MSDDYYFVSDLHLGGDGQLQNCDFADEFIAFLGALLENGTDTELILVGDTFGFWENTALQSVAKLEAVIESHRAIFQQFKATGEAIRITLAVGNHDYDLACDPAFAARLRAYNIHVETAAAFTRPIGGRHIWIEHGHQTDGFNASLDYGHPHALPMGYFVTQTIVGEANRFSTFGRGEWMKDIRSVRIPEIPAWLLSNYFYRELGLAMTCIALPFVALLGLNLLLALAAILHAAGIADWKAMTGIYPHPWGLSGRATLGIALAVDGLVLSLLLLIAQPFRIVMRDMRTGIRRFQTLAYERSHYDPTSPESYLRRVRAVFDEHPDVALYVFGHTHDALLTRQGDRVAINTGTWLKILRRVPAWLPFLPAVYYPSFRLNYFHVSAEGEEAIIEYVEIEKAAPQDLSWLQRLVTWGRHRQPPRWIPHETRLNVRPERMQRALAPAQPEALRAS